MAQVCVALSWAVSVPASAGYREDSIVDFMNQMRRQEVSSYTAQLGGLHETYLNESASRDRKLVSLGLGVHYLERNPRLALQYLSSAELACRPTDPLRGIVRFYLAQAKFKAGAYREAMAVATDVLATQPGIFWSRQLYTLIIESAYGANDYDRVVRAFDEFSKAYSFSRNSETLARYAAMALERQGDMKRATEVLEELARSYPATEGSRWAFHRLEALSCDSQKIGRPRYVFSTKLLHSLSRNVILGNGLREFITEIVERPLRQEDGSVRTMSLAERADFFFRARLYRESIEVTKELYEIERHKPESTILPNVIYELGRIHLRLWEPMMASRYFSMFLAEFPRHPLGPRANEYLGDSLRNAGLPLTAAESYATAATQRDSRLLRWHHFWSLLRGREYQGALNLLEQPSYVEPRDGDDKLTIDYWHAKILEHLGRKDEADDKYLSILSHSADTYYANMVAVIRPDLVERGTETKAVAEDDKEERPFSLAARLLPRPAAVAEGAEPTAELKLVDELRELGLRDAANTQLAGLKWSAYAAPQAFAAASRVAHKLDDYNPTRRIKYSVFSPLRTLPKSWWDYVQHQIDHLSQWKIYYPVAYEKTLTDVASRIRINPFLVLSVMRAESFYNKDARSGVGAQGLMQLMPYTAMKIATLVNDQRFEIQSLGRPEVNIGYGAYYLDKLLRYYGDNPFLAVAAYNGGPIAVNQWLDSCKDCTADEFVESIQYRETRRYVREVMKNFSQYMRIYTGRQALSGLPPMPETLPDGEEIF